LALSYLDVTYY